MRNSQMKYSEKKKHSWVRRILLTVLLLLAITAGAFGIYVEQYYHADSTAMAALENTDSVTVRETSNYILFDGPGSESAYIFYPGAKVETESYAPLMQKIAENGMDTFLVKMPFRLAFFGLNRADEIMEEQTEYTSWYIGGHSLGGAMAASYAAKHLDVLDGAILLAAYPTAPLAADGFRVLSVYGSADLVLNMENFENGRQYMPENYTEVIIDGGNHAGFGNYGEQKGDGVAEISSEEQQTQTAEAVFEMTHESSFENLYQSKNSSETNEAEYFEMPTAEEKSTIYVKAVDGISDDFIRGVDVSTVLVEENSGVVYYGEDGTEQDIFLTLAQAGVNYVRLRVWNDPYDENGNGYGGGNNDVPTAIALGQRASKYGMRVCVDFHYSDFWADPKRQHAPKAWKDMTVDEKCDALYAFTKESLSQMLEEGVDVGMVQVGNEINNAMAGEDFKPNINKLLKAGCQAVREISEAYNRDIKIVIHYTNIDKYNEISNLVAGLTGAHIDYDIIGLSYYPFWDGSIENMQSVAEQIQEKSGKQVLIAETSYGYTSEDGDGCANSFSGIDDVVDGYPATVQGQANMIRDICAAANEADMLGVFYWEPAWIPVGPADEDNSAVWEEYGSGWASSYASDYDPEDAGLYYGGCSWDNQAMFDFTGHPLASLNVWKYLKYGAVAEKAVDAVSEINE